jgi:hypothetical protein
MSYFHTCIYCVWSDYPLYYMFFSPIPISFLYLTFWMNFIMLFSYIQITYIDLNHPSSPPFSIFTSFFHSFYSLLMLITQAQKLQILCRLVRIVLSSKFTVPKVFNAFLSLLFQPLSNWWLSAIPNFFKF